MRRTSLQTKSISCTVYGCDSAKVWPRKSCTTTTACTLPSKKCRKRSTKDKKTRSSTVCAHTSSPTRQSAHLRPEAAVVVSAFPSSKIWSSLSKLRSAMATAPRRDRNGHRALRAVFSGRRYRGRGFLRPAVDLLNDDEYAERDDQEADDRIEKDPIVRRRRSRRLA